MIQTLRDAITPYRAYARIAFKEGKRYFFTDHLLGAIAMVGYVSVALLIWSGSQQTLFLGMYTWPQLVWYLVLTQIIIGTGSSEAIKTITQHIQTGTIISYLSQPIGYPGALFATHVGTIIIDVLAALLLLLPFAYFIAGASPLTLLGLGMGIIALMGALIIDFGISVSLGLLSFWTEDASPYRWIYGKLVFLFGGLLFPLDALPVWLGSIAKVLPPAFILYYPARLVVDFSWELFGTVLVGQIVYVVLCLGMTWFIFKQGVKKVHLHGG